MLRVVLPWLVSLRQLGLSFYLVLLKVKSFKTCVVWTTAILIASKSWWYAYDYAVLQQRILNQMCRAYETRMNKLYISSKYLMIWLTLMRNRNVLQNTRCRCRVFFIVLLRCWLRYLPFFLAALVKHQWLNVYKTNCFQDLEFGSDDL